MPRGREHNPDEFDDHEIEDFDPDDLGKNRSDDPENPDESDMDSYDGPALVACPYCGKMISEDTEICHLCGSYISQEDSHTPVPVWIWVGVLLGLLGMLWCTITFIWNRLS